MNYLLSAAALFLIPVQASAHSGPPVHLHTGENLAALAAGLLVIGAAALLAAKRRNAGRHK